MRRSLQRRIVASVLLGLGVVLVGLGYVVTLAFNHSRDAALHERLAVAQAKQHELTQEFQDALDLLGRMRQDVTAVVRVGASAAAHASLRHVLDEAGIFSGVAVLSPGGKVMAADGVPSWLAWLQSSPPFPPLPAGEPGGVFEVGAQPPGLGLLSPVAIDGRTVAWLVAELHPARLQRHLMPDHLGSGTYGAEVLAADGRVVVTSADRAKTAIGHARLIAELARQHRPGTVLHSPPGGRAHYVAYVPLTIPAGWGVLIEQPQDVVVAIPLHLRRWMIGIGATVLLAATLVAWLDVRRVTRPLRALTDAAGRIGHGDLITPVHVVGDDEVGVLGRTLEEMRIRLRRSLDEVQENAQTVATLQERERLARELHDGLAQALATVYSVAGVGKLRLAKRNRDGVERTLNEILVLSRQAYEEVRQSIFGLRTMVSRGLGLIPAIAEYLHEFSERSGVTVQLIVEDERATRLAPQVESQLIRIIQEALTNVWRHAGAQRAVIRFGVDHGMARVTVEDDGLGFASQADLPTGDRHFGLQTMRERAESVGGTLQVESAPGRGTRVEVSLPVDSQG